MGVTGRAEVRNRRPARHCTVRTNERSGLAGTEAGERVRGGQAGQRASRGWACLGSLRLPGRMPALPGQLALPGSGPWFPFLNGQPLALDSQRLAQSGLVARQAGAQKRKHQNKISFQLISY